MERANYGIPREVRMRAYIPHAVILFIVFAAYLLLFQFLLGSVTHGISELKRIADSPTNEIVYAKEPNAGESFYYLKNYAAYGDYGENAVSDLLMVMPDEEYSENFIYFSGSLEKGSCAVSANTASKHSLKKGSVLRIIGTDKSFRVDRIITAQSGLDKDYEHEGIIVLAFDEELLDKNYMYLSFDNDGDGYRSLDRLIYIEDMAEGVDKTLGLCACIVPIAMIMIMLLCEYFLFRKRKNDYAILISLGVNKSTLFFRILLENALKYLLPSVGCALIYSVSYSCYRVAYAVPILIFILICAFSCIFYSMITSRRLYYVGTK